MNQKLFHYRSCRLLLPIVCATVLAVLPPVAQARPYATSLTNDAGVISFRLNEDADSVKIISGGGTVTNDLGPLPKGLTVTNLGLVGVFKVQVAKTSGPGFPQGVVNQISDDDNNFVKFANQRGLSVNRNTNSPYFGRIYVSVSAPGTAGGRSVADGVYMLNADQTDAVGQGDTPRTGGLNFDFFAATADSPGRIFVGPDDHLYLSDWTAPNGGLWVVDANAATNAAATNVLFGIGGPSAETNFHGSISGIWTEGSLAAGDLVVYTQDEDLDSNNGVYRYDIGAGPLPFEGAGTLAFTYGNLAGFGQYTKILRGRDGKWYCSHRRAEQTPTGNQTAGVFVLSEDGSTPLWNSLTAWQQIGGVPSNHDVYFGETRGFDVSPDGKYLVGFRAAARTLAPTYTANTVIVVRLQDGVPDLNTVVVMPTTPTLAIGRELTFDAAGNIYTVSSGQGLLRIYSPGGFSVVTTGSDGTFDVFVPDVDLTVAATQNLASEPNINGEFTITRASQDISQPLTVYFTVSGTATEGTDYVLQTNSVTLTTNVVVIPANELSVVVSLVVTDDSEAELTETARLGLSPDETYTVLSQPATVTIDDDEEPAIDITTVQGTVFEANQYDYARFQLTRRGRLNDALSVEIQSGGDTARYVAAGPITIDPTVVNQTFDVNPVDDDLLNGNGTISLTVGSGIGYTVGVITPNATATIVDDEVPPAPVLFADDFTGDPSTNWVVRFASGNGIDDYRINDQVITLPATPYDYSFEGIPPAPNGSDTLGLKLTVNKDEASPLGGAGINLYPIGQSFSGDYALRFDMYTILNANVATTEQVLFGINHSGDRTNWFRSSNNGYTNSAYDGQWCVIVNDASGLGTYNGNAPSGDYILVSAPQVNVGGIWGPSVLANRDADSFVDTFKNPPWGVAGLPGVPSNPGVTFTPGWAQVELSQIGNVITLKINNTTIFSHASVGAHLSGNIMLGYSDSYDSIANNNSGSVIYDNVRVVGLTQPKLEITSADRSGTTTVLTFTWTTDDPVSAFTILQATGVNGVYSGTAATIVKLAPGVYQATVENQSDDAAFYRVGR